MRAHLARPVRKALLGLGQPGQPALLDPLARPDRAAQPGLPATQGPQDHPDQLALRVLMALQDLLGHLVLPALRGLLAQPDRVAFPEPLLRKVPPDRRELPALLDQAV